VKIDILGAKIDKNTLSETLHNIEGFLNSDKPHYIVTVNPEIVLAAQKDAEFKDMINKADLVVPDGAGLLFASRWLDRKNFLPERITGVD